MTSAKHGKIAALLEGCHGRPLPAQYLGYFRCFNGGLFYEAHEVLEDLWRPARHEPGAAFYKGLIQLAGAFVHLQRHNRSRPRLQAAAALFRLARANLAAFQPTHQHLNVAAVLKDIDGWLASLEHGDGRGSPLHPEHFPRLALALEH